MQANMREWNNYGAAGSTIQHNYHSNQLQPEIGLLGAKAKALAGAISGRNLFKSFFLLLACCEATFLLFLLFFLIWGPKLYPFFLTDRHQNQTFLYCCSASGSMQGPGSQNDFKMELQGAQMGSNGVQNDAKNLVLYRCSA